jgi:hypothetical protein
LLAFIHVGLPTVLSQTMRFSLSVFAASLLAVAQASNVAELIPGNFDSVLAGKPGLVELYVYSLPLTNKADGLEFSFAPWWYVLPSSSELTPVYRRLVAVVTAR